MPTPRNPNTGPMDWLLGLYGDAFGNPNRRRMNQNPGARYTTGQPHDTSKLKNTPPPTPPAGPPTSGGTGKSVSGMPRWMTNAYADAYGMPWYQSAGQAAGVGSGAGGGVSGGAGAGGGNAGQWTQNPNYRGAPGTTPYSYAPNSGYWQPGGGRADTVPGSSADWQEWNDAGGWSSGLNPPGYNYSANQLAWAAGGYGLGPGDTWAAPQYGDSYMVYPYWKYERDPYWASGNGQSGGYRSMPGWMKEIPTTHLSGGYRPINWNPAWNKGPRYKASMRDYEKQQAKKQYERPIDQPGYTRPTGPLGSGNEYKPTPWYNNIPNWNVEGPISDNYKQAMAKAMVNWNI